MTSYLDSRICQQSILRDFIIHLEEIEIIPLDGYKLDDEAIDYCKGMVMEVANELLKLNSSIKLKLFKLQHLNLTHIERNTKLDEFQDKKPIGKDYDGFQKIFLIVFDNTFIFFFLYLVY